MSHKILIVDDDPVICSFFSEVLAAEGMEVDRASTAAEGVRKTAGKPYDMVILDYLLPDGNGADFLRSIPAATGAKNLLVTGHLTRDMVVAMFRLGICGYLAKPVSSEELVYNVRFHLNATKKMAYTR